MLPQNEIECEEHPNLGLVDSRNVKTSHHMDSNGGIDENKLILKDLYSLNYKVFRHLAIGYEYLAKISLMMVKMD